MTDWRFEFGDALEPGPGSGAHHAMKRRLQGCSERAAKAQTEFRHAVDELIQAVTEAAEAGLPPDRIAPLAAMTEHDVERILDTGRLF